MTGKKSLAIFVVLIGIFLFHSAAIAATVGFVSSPGIFFSKDKFFAGEQIKVYCVAVNNSYARLTTTVIFLDNGTEFGRATTDITLEQARQINVFWTPTQANHNIVAKFISAIGYDTNGIAKILNEEEINDLAPAISKQITVDGDIDHDTLGDHDEPVYNTSPLVADTDGDGLTDGAEVYIHRTNPAKADTDGDGMNDGDEIKVGRNPLIADTPPPVAQLPAVTIPKITQQQPSTTPLKSPTTPKRSATTPKTASPAAATTNTSITATTTTTTISPTKTKIENIPGAPTIKIADKKPPVITQPAITPIETNWIKVLGIIAALLVIAAGASGLLAWREQNKY